MANTVLSPRINGRALPHNRRPLNLTARARNRMCPAPDTVLPIPRSPANRPRSRSNSPVKATSMSTQSLLLLPGDGIGPEVMAEVARVVALFN